MKTAAPKLSDAEKVGILIGALLFVIRGLRAGSVSSQPIMLQDDKAKSYPMVTLESELWKALKKCGITEKKP